MQGARDPHPRHRVVALRRRFSHDAGGANLRIKRPRGEVVDLACQHVGGMKDRQPLGGAARKQRFLQQRQQRREIGRAPREIGEARVAGQRRQAERIADRRKMRLLGQGDGDPAIGAVRANLGGGALAADDQVVLDHLHFPGRRGIAVVLPFALGVLHAQGPFVFKAAVAIQRDDGKAGVQAERAIPEAILHDLARCVSHRLKNAEIPAVLVQGKFLDKLHARAGIGLAGHARGVRPRDVPCVVTGPEILVRGHAAELGTDVDLVAAGGTAIKLRRGLARKLRIFPKDVFAV